MVQDPVFNDLIKFINETNEDSSLVKFLNKIDVDIDNIKKLLLDEDFDTENVTLGIDGDLHLEERIDKKNYMKIKSAGLYLDAYSIVFCVDDTVISISAVTPEGSNCITAISCILLSGEFNEQGNPKFEYWEMLENN